MKSFKDFKIEKPVNSFAGEKIAVDRILNKEIIVHHYTVEPSKKKEGTMCLNLQIEVDGAKRLIFTGSKSLMNQITQVAKDDFPFTTAITKEDRRLSFT
ncbi:MAG: hypothetical protein ACYC1Q_07710 [Bacteroidia bacterium]